MCQGIRNVQCAMGQGTFNVSKDTWYVVYCMNAVIAFLRIYYTSSLLLSCFPSINICEWKRVCIICTWIFS